MSIWEATFKGLKTDLPRAHVDLSSKTVIVTGANAGLGKEVATKLAAMKPAKLILAVRTPEKGEAARADILKDSPGLNASAIEIWSLDMASFASVKAFGSRVNTELERLDVLVANAGIMAGKWEVTKDGWESELQVNVLSTQYLVELVLPLAQKTASAFYSATSESDPNILSKPHISVVSSGLHYIAKLKAAKGNAILKTMNQEPSFNAMDRYTDTKVMEVYLVRELVKRKGRDLDGIVINTCNPGWCHSNLADSQNSPWLVNTLKNVLARPTEMGARAIVWAAVNGEKQGWYSTNCVDEEPAPAVRSSKGQKVQEQLYDEVADVLEGLDA